MGILSWIILGGITLTFRAYWPDKEVAEGKWYPPGVTPV